IGRAIALRLARAGMAVGIADLDGGNARAVANEIVIAGGRALGAAADVSDLSALAGAVRAVGEALGPVDVLVNNAGWERLALFVGPGPADTQLLRDVMAGERGAKILAGIQRAIPLGRLAAPEDVAGAVAYLVSEEAAYVTGQVLSVSGGLTMAG